MEELYLERLELAEERLRLIPEEQLTPLPFRDFFTHEAAFLSDMLTLYREDPVRADRGLSAEELAAENRKLYEELLPENYDSCWGNPAAAADRLGKAYGPLFSFLYAELRGTIVYVFEQRGWDLLISLELFLEIYGMFTEEELPEAERVRDSLYWYVSDYLPEVMEYRIRELVDPSLDFAAKIILQSDLSNPSYLYRYGEYVTENERGTAAFLASLPQEEIDAMASNYTEGYRIGFLLGGKDLNRKKTVNIRYQLGFERMVRAAIGQFEKMGLQPVIYRAASHSANKRQHLRIGYSGAVANRQYESDHKGDAALYLDENMISRKLRAQQEAFEKMKSLANTHAGPACIEVFGEEPFTPAECPEALRLNEKQQRLQVGMDQESAQITNRYIIGKERSFTIIAYPVPEIGADYEAIFRETVRINTLDYRTYQQIQQCLIDALDTGEQVRILGANGNRTDLTVQLHQLQDPEKETNFENCVADVNIPVGEVFTSPLLKGTNGILHVSSVYLGEYYYKDLEIEIRDGKTVSYSCGNFPSEEENRRYIEENILYHHETLPMGEFAIGTNTTAYRMAKDYHIAAKLPILIAEKCGPHFAFGDTCYSWQEDTPVFNPDGKEIIARDNECSILRKTAPEQAYFGCHTDITIPYEELGEIRVLRKDGSSELLLEKGHFVLPGTESLNEPLDR